MKGSVMNVLPSLIAIVLVLSNIETTECGLIKNYKKENDYSHSTNNRSYEAHIQDNAQIRAVPAQQMVSLLPNQPCYTQFFVNGNPPRGLRSGNNILQHMRYICQQVNGQVYYATMFDQSHGIAVFSAYVVTATNVNFNTNNQRPAPSWTQTPGIARQGSDAIYRGQQFDKGHLVPGATYSSTRDSVRSTYVYTNAVPQKPSFNRGQWCQFEKRIRAYAPQCTNNGGRLYLLTGTSFRRIQNTAQGTNAPPVAQLGPVVRGRTTYPAISIPNLMWTAGCCVLRNGQTRSFAVLGNNLQTAAQMLTTQMPVSFLENILLQDVLHHAIGGPAVSLFPGNAACSNMQNNIQNLPAAQG